MKPVLIAFADGDEYQEPLSVLRQDCIRHDQPHDCRFNVITDAQPPTMTRRQWVCRQIPGFILSQLDKWCHPVLYVHGDYRLRGPLPDAAIDPAWDIGLHKRWFWVPDSELRVLPAPIYANRTDAARRFLNVWNALCMNVLDADYEHWKLQQTLELVRKDPTISVGYFDPPISSVGRHAGVPLVGHKGA